jgi:hypothetical protein
MDSPASIFESLLKEVKEIFGDNGLNNFDVPKLLVLTPRIVKLVQQAGVINSLSGQEKKELLLSLVLKLISTAPIDDDAKSNVKTFVEIAYPYVIDGIVYAYKSDAFDQIKAKSKKCFDGCMKKN